MYEKVKEKMQEMHLTTNALARKAGITPTDLYAAFAGKKEFFKGWKKRVAAALETDESIFEE